MIEFKLKEEEFLNEYDKREEDEKAIKFMILMNRGFKEIEKHDKLVTGIDISPKIFSIMESLGEEYFNKECDDSDVVGYFWTADVRVKEDLNGSIVFSHDENKYK